MLVTWITGLFATAFLAFFFFLWATTVAGPEFPTYVLILGSCAIGQHVAQYRMSAPTMSKVMKYLPPAIFTIVLILKATAWYAFPNQLTPHGAFVRIIGCHTEALLAPLVLAFTAVPSWCLPAAAFGRTFFTVHVLITEMRLTDAPDLHIVSVACAMAATAGTSFSLLIMKTLRDSFIAEVGQHHLQVHYSSEVQ